MIISPHNALQLPLHDALMNGPTITSSADGFLTATLNVKINREESVHPLRELGITSSEFDLVFTDCWQVRINLLGFSSTPEVISALEVEDESALIESLRSVGIGTRNITHFRIEGSHGSQLDFLATEFSVVEPI